MSDQTEINSAEAEFILNHPIFKGAFEAVKEYYVQQLESSQVQDDDSIKALTFGLKALALVKREIEQHIRNHKVAVKRGK